MGGEEESVGTHGARRTDRAHLPPRRLFCHRFPEHRISRAQRRGHQPGAGSFGDEETTGRVVAGVQEDMCGGTSWQGRPAMRIGVSSWDPTDADVERSLAAMLRVAAQETTRRR